MNNIERDKTEIIMTLIGQGRIRFFDPVVGYTEAPDTFTLDSSWDARRGFRSKDGRLQITEFVGYRTLADAPDLLGQDERYNELIYTQPLGVFQDG